ncbi:hypothetical protein ABGV42_23660 [Paenibacillus pabuli]|uniref:Uncharacterized protein n=1 Tax=Paenibacillus illinoisensis TaxID=59845 RepID=A0A2W0CFV1_9BACL|nr:hypothetical protein [Paenibacillus illinoisensis]PYY29679.1 Uncharacterized protein PIL02S_01879 [Paenibacillus illinoisensis]
MGNSDNNTSNIEGTIPLDITNIIKKELAERLHKLSFEYQNSSINPWIFVRSRDGFSKEIIEIDLSDYQSYAIRCTFQTDLKSISSTQLAEGTVHEWYVYKNEEELFSILKLFGEITEKFGLEWFAKNVANQPFTIPNYLENDWLQSIDNFIQTNQLELESSSALLKLDELIAQGLNPNEIYLAGFCFGEMIVKHFGAVWEFDKEQGPMIKNIGGLPNFNKSPHNLVGAVLGQNNLTLQRYYNDIKFVVDQL